MNLRQVEEWKIFEKLEPFEPERADIRSGVQTFWLRDLWLEKHSATPKTYTVSFEEEQKTEAAELMAQVAEIFCL